ncbi:MAG: hypothetical protein J0M35_02085 [Candidatus Obscuribacter phosphatis]|jgi:hypothetical protein|uniref:Uncharacterized protein n=1 Tax=Candidatus Obscuribacter phosphatis TaxID=1906157 RepID=A0A8J7P8V0_9BACT|nr:hypothetical protein [Candidatus Obscuribacter phosphatis]
MTHMKRKKRATILLELSCGVLFLMALFMMAVDISLMMLAYQLNEKCCKEACRAAAQQKTSTAAMQAATTALAIHQGDGVYISSPRLATIPGAFEYQDFGGDPLVGHPYVAVTTEITVKLPVPVIFIGNDLGKGGIGMSDTWVFRKRYSYPIVDLNLTL